MLPRPPSAAQAPPELLRWLGTLEVTADGAREAFARVLKSLGHEAPPDGLGALRLWGQTGDRPAVWVAAADPIFLEPRLDSLLARRLQAEELPIADVKAAFLELQEHLAAPGGFGFSSVGKLGYLRSDSPLSTAEVSPAAVYDRDPAGYLPSGGEAAVYHRLHSEVQMVLHQSSLQGRRASAGLPPINALWIWGGGTAGEAERQPLPPLFTHDPLLTGYWLRCGQVATDWPGSVRACAERTERGFVAATPEASASASGEACVSYLGEIKALLDGRRLAQAVLLFRHGPSARGGRRAWWRWRRRDASWLGADSR